jgi:C4-dicarboxylate-specific signal transduction histidine kinase
MMIVSTVWVYHSYYTQRHELDTTVRTSAWIVFQTALEHESLNSLLSECRRHELCDGIETLLRAEIFASRLDILANSTETDMLSFIGPYESILNDTYGKLSAVFRLYPPEVAKFNGAALAAAVANQIGDFTVTLQEILRDATIYNSDIEQRAALLSSTDPAIPFAGLWASAVALIVSLIVQVRRSRRALSEVQSLRRDDYDRQQSTVQLLDTLGSPIIVGLADGTVAYCNSAARQAFGISPGHKEPRTLIPNLAALSDPSGSGVLSIETLTKGRRSFQCSSSTFAWFGSAAILYALHDNSVERDAQLAAIETGRLIVLGELSSSIAHELNQPLSTIKMAALNARMLLASSAQDAVNQKLNRIDDQVDRAARIISNIRKLALPNKVTEIFNVRNSIETCISLVGQQFVVANLHIHTDFHCAAEPLAVGNSTLFEVAVTNLLLNARDAFVGRSQTEGNGVVQISIECAERIAIRVRDNAGGIDPTILTRLFDSFATTKNGAGMGLGLSISRRSIEDMRGSLVAANVSDGAVFTIEVPLAS